MDPRRTEAGKVWERWCLGSPPRKRLLCNRRGIGRGGGAVAGCTVSLTTSGYSSSGSAGCCEATRLSACLGCVPLSRATTTLRRGRCDRPHRVGGAYFRKLGLAPSSS
eukprot:Sspe_Gene.74081::Locus_45491_Transcript_1_1_Confidence_1.000_Length_1238::g.74081::m.74081